jgi:hypothetical protein
MAATVRAAAKPRPKDSPARRNVPPRPVPDDDTGPLNDAGFEPVRLAPAGAEAAESVPLFYIGDEEYRVLKRPGMNIALRYMRLVRTEGEAAAQDYMLTALLGVEGYEALMNYDGLKPEEFAQIVEIAAKLTLGPLETPKG